MYILGFMAEPGTLGDFEQLILPHMNAAYNLARWLLRSDQDAQDVVHDSFLRAHRYFASFQGDDARAWLLGIVRNSCLTSLQKKKLSEPLTAVHERHGRSSDIIDDPEKSLLLKENVASLRGCIEALPPEYREVVVMRELEELSYKEIAAVSGIALGTVMSRLNRARKRLENCLSKALHEAPHDV
jgi:RNA polymerase sigma-70 factor (ECF subfamily)